MGISPQDLLKAEAKGLSASEFAEAYGLEGKAFRVYLRSQGIRVGKGRSHNFSGPTDPSGVKHLIGYFAGRGKKGVTEDDLKRLREYIAEKAKQA